MLHVKALPLAELRERSSEKWREYPADVLPLFVAETDFPLAPAISTALQRAVEIGDTGYIASRTPLAESFASFASRRYGWEPDPARMRSTADVSMGIVEILRRVTQPGERIVVTPPVYPPFYDLVAEAGAEVERVPLGDTGTGWELDLDGIRTAFEDGATAILLCNPHNPTGTIAGREELEAISQIVERHGGRVFADEIHAPLRYDGAPFVPYASVSQAAAAHTVTGTSASKAWNIPGLKTAQLITSNDADQQLYTRFGFAVQHGAATLGVVASTAAYRSGKPWLTDVIEYLDGSRRQLASLVDEHLPGAVYRVPEATYIGWIDTSALGIPGPPAAFFREQAGVVLTEGRLLGRGAEGHARVVFATPRPVLDEAFAAMGAAVRRAGLAA